MAHWRGGSFGPRQQRPSRTMSMTSIARSSDAAAAVFGGTSGICGLAGRASHRFKLVYSVGISFPDRPVDDRPIARVGGLRSARTKR